jgi:MFS family permease
VTKRRSNVSILGWAAFWSGMAQEMVYPLLPVFLVVALGSSKTALGVVEGLLGVGVTVARIGSGRAVDRGASALWLTRVSYAVSLLARPLIALAPAVAVVGMLRVADGLGKGGKDGPRDMLVAADAGVGTMGRSFGLQIMLDTFGSVAGPIIAGCVLLLVGHDASGLRIVFALAAIPAIGAARQLRLAHYAPRRVPSEHDHATSLPRAFWMLFAAVTLFGLANSSDTLLLLRASSAGLSAANVAFLFAGFNLVYALLAVPVGVLSDRFGRRPLLFAAWVSYIVVYVGFAFATNALVLVGLFLLYGVFYAAGEGTIKAWVTTLVPADRRAYGFGLMAAASGLLLLPASVIAGVLWDHYGAAAPFLFGAVTATVALVVLASSRSLRHP